MKKALTAKQIGLRIKKRRETKGFSQLELAEKLSVSRTSIVQLEVGNRNLAAVELFKISEIFECTMEDIMRPKTEVRNYPIIEEPMIAYKTSKRESTPKVHRDKLESIFTYLIQACAAMPFAEEAIYNRILYLCDFNYYETFEEHLSGMRYKKLSTGPVSNELSVLLTTLIKEKKVQRLKIQVSNKKQIRLFTCQKPNLLLFNAAEKSTMDQVINQISHWNIDQLNKHIYQDMPWQATEEGDWIHYNLAFYRDSSHSVRQD